MLRDLGVAGEVRELPESAPTAAAAAAQLGCELGAIANSLVFSADGAPLLVMTSGAHRVDTAKVASLIGASEVARANARSVREWTGQAIGGVAPVGHPSPIRTLVDTWLDKYDEIWAAGGHPHTVFPTSYAELIRITNGTPADVGFECNRCCSDSTDCTRNVFGAGWIGRRLAGRPGVGWEADARGRSDASCAGSACKASPGDLPPDAELGDFIRERITAATSR